MWAVVAGFFSVAILSLASDQVLHEAAQPVEAITPDIDRLVTDMIETMYAAPGVGLAAPQPLVAEITGAAVGGLHLAPGVRVTATWKATATRLVSL